ncbi:MAG: Mbeg1-like protein [Actinomycetota bacterium]
MGLSFPNPINAAKNLVNDLEDSGKTVVTTTVKITETTVNVTEHAAVNYFQFEAAVTKFALQQTFDGAKMVASKSVDMAGKGVNLAAQGLDSLTHPGDPNPPAAQGLKFSETKSACDIAYKSSNSKVNDIYQFPDGRQWKVMDVKNDPQTGFRAVALKPVDPNDKRVIVAFSGSDEGKDWGDNVKQGIGLSTAQYKEAVDFANKWKASNGSNVILTGHSLGGGLASYASIKTNLHATAVNSAPLALDHLGLNPFDALRITQYYVPGEALSVLNKANPFDIRPGFGIEVQGRNSILDPRSIGSNHSLDNVAPDIPAPKYVGNFN